MSILNATIMRDTNAAARAFVAAHARPQGIAPVPGICQDGQGLGGCRGKAGGPAFQR